MDSVAKSLALYPPQLINGVAGISRRTDLQVHFCGGVVRDWLLGREPIDLDIVVPERSCDFAQQVAKLLGGAYVPLSLDEGVARVVWRGYQIDVSSFRDGARTIDEDLMCRDFTVNAMALKLDAVNHSFAAGGGLIDPMFGAADLHQHLIRAVSEDIFIKDPLRLLRAFRFMAVLGFALDPRTAILIKNHGTLISHSAGERISAELKAIFTCDTSAKFFASMHKVGLLHALVAECTKHPDDAMIELPTESILDHCLLTLDNLEKIIRDPEQFFPCLGKEVTQFLEEKDRKMCLKYAALFHDLARVQNRRERTPSVVKGVALKAELLSQVADRLKWSSEDKRRIFLFVKCRGWPLDMIGLGGHKTIPLASCLQLIQTAGADFIGIFLLAMADCLAGKSRSPADLGESIGRLFTDVFQVCDQRIFPVLQMPPLLSGHDLISKFGLSPGPLFTAIFRKLLTVRLENPAMTKDEAVVLVKEYLRLRH